MTRRVYFVLIRRRDKPRSRWVHVDRPGVGLLAFASRREAVAEARECRSPWWEAKVVAYEAEEYWK